MRILNDEIPLLFFDRQVQGPVHGFRFRCRLQQRLCSLNLVLAKAKVLVNNDAAGIAHEFNLSTNVARMCTKS